METSPKAPIGVPGKRIYVLSKRVVDIIGALAGICVLAPLLILIAIVVKLSSPGPIFYRGVRAGLHGKPFRIFKFRTMVSDAELQGGPTTSTRDPRVTPVGWFLRRTKIDEIPQLINVLLGDMSLVGPRPEVMDYASRYEGDEKLILSMRPGITDYASIVFANLDDRVGSNDADVYFQRHILPEKNRLRVKYVTEWSLVGDLKILWNTTWRVLKRWFGR
jgi:lipopolysaccharide/colanic/teichoic acid biosynthesis glycosyltransferase